MSPHNATDETVGIPVRTESDGSGANLSNGLFYEGVLSAIDEAVVAFDSAGDLCFANGSAVELLGVDRAKLAEMSLDRLQECDKPRVRTLCKALKSGAATNLRLPTGLLNCTAPVLAKVRPVQADSSLDGAFAIFQVREATEEETLRLERRANLERTLVDLSGFFVSNDQFDSAELLKEIGEGIGADHIYLITAPPDDPAHIEQMQLLSYSHDMSAGTHDVNGWPVPVGGYEYRDWWSDGAAARSGDLGDDSDDGLVAYAVPILGISDKLYGYLGIEYFDQAPDWLEDSARLLDVLGDMLSGYLERQLAEQALRASEERYRLFVTTISEGIWCLEPEEPISPDLPAEQQLELLRKTAVITECNQTMARLLGEADQATIVGKRVRDLSTYGFTNAFLLDFIQNNYTLHGHEYILPYDGETDRHFVTNAVGTMDGGSLKGIWCSWTDVTERAELERRMVTALEQQQQRIGHELHDGVGQLITSVSMLSQNLAERYFTPGERGHEQAMKIVRFTRESQQLLRQLQQGLAPVQVSGRGLAESLRGLARNTDDLPGINCTFHWDGATDATETELKLQLYRIAQEAINNALKHADPTHIAVRFETEGERTILEVTDNGKGFDPEDVVGESLGLVSIQYRARALNCNASINSVRGEGTSVTCLIDCDRFTIT